MPPFVRQMGITAALLFVLAARGNAGEPVPPAVCGGVSSEFVIALPDSYLVADLGPFVLRVDTSVTVADFDSIVSIFTLLLPSMIDIVGEPSAKLDTLTLAFENEVRALYYTSSRTIQMLTYPGYSTGRWNNLLLHALTHAFYTEVRLRPWEAEGIAEAARYFVSEYVTKKTGVDFRWQDFRHIVGQHDMNNRAGAQFVSGSGGMSNRLDLRVAYGSAASVFIIPVFAQLSGSGAWPHPLARLHEAIEQSENVWGADVFMAMDRAWKSPVDGVMPPSRWARAQAITSLRYRDGEFVRLAPDGSPVNEEFIHVHWFARVRDDYLRYTPTEPIRFVDTWGRTFFPSRIETNPAVPRLAPGAYAVEIEQPSTTGEMLRARSWILRTEPVYRLNEAWTGVAAIFIDGSGRTVNLPPGAITVNGRLDVQVPGGVIATPNDSRQSELTFRVNGRVVGTVTITGDLPRAVVFSIVGEDMRGVVDWEPYHPVAGQSMMARIRLSESALDPDESAVIVQLWDDYYNLLATAPMQKVTDDVMSATLPVDGSLISGHLEFEGGGGSWHGEYETPFRTIPDSVSSKASMQFDGESVRVRWERAVAAADFVLQQRADTASAWLTVPVAATQPGPRTLAWSTTGWLNTGRYVRVVSMGGGDGDGDVACAQYIAAANYTPGFSPRAPFPNPSGGAITWLVDVGSPTTASFSVYDVTGRRLFSQDGRVLQPGTEMFQWGRISAERRVASGVYFLRLDAVGRTFIRKIVISGGE